MKKAPYQTNDKKLLDKANYNTEILKQWLIENTRIPKLPLSRDSILKNFNLESAQPFLEVSQLVTYNGKDLLENGLVLTQYDKTLCNLIGVAVQDVNRKTIYIGKRGITAFNIEQSIRKDIFLCSTKINTVIKLAETGYQVALSDFETLDSEVFSLLLNSSIRLRK